MKKILLFAVLAVAGCAKKPATTPTMDSKDKPTVVNATATAFAYPKAKKSDQVDDYHGTKVADPYRWLEDPDSPETQAWVKAENDVTMPFLASIPARERIKQRMTKLWNYEKYGVPFQEGGRYFWFKNDGLQPQAVLYTATALDAQPRVLLDPNVLAKDGTTALGGLAVSEDGKKLAYGLAMAGSDWNEWKVRDVATGKDDVDHVKWVKFSGASWTKDQKGFFYSRYQEPAAGAALEEVNHYQKLYFHRVGTPQSEDVLVYERPDQKEWGFDGTVTEDGKWLVITVWKGTDAKNAVYVKDLTKGTLGDKKVIPIRETFDAEYTLVDNEGSVLWFKNNLGAPRGRLIAIDVKKPDEKNWKVVIPEAKETLGDVDLVGERFFASYLKDAYSAVRVHDLKGKLLSEVALPGIGTASGFNGERKDKETFYSFTSFLEPGTIYRYDVASGKSAVFQKPTVDFDASAYETKQIFYASKDGTKIPMFITARKGLKLDGTTPTILYGYGGFNASMTPAFSASVAVWLEMGGAYAVANLRGGGEYGEEWHQLGTKERKQNVFDDFIAAAEWLIANKYTSTPKLAIAGGSNGGLLVGAAITQRPELFGAALPAVGVMDMLRFHKFTIGWAWVDDYGSADDAAQFRTLHAYSPLHNLKAGTKYPSTLITTADHDDRVVPAHSFKFAAALQEAHAGPNPVLIRIETKAGHGAGKPTAKVIEETADKWAFLVKTLDVKVPGEFGAGS